MSTPLEDLFKTRTHNDGYGRLLSKWDDFLFWRDIERLIADGHVEAVEPPASAIGDFRERKYFREVSTGDVYVYVPRVERRAAPKWTRSPAEFRKLC